MCMAVSTREACPVRSSQALAKATVDSTAPLTPGSSRPMSARACARATAAATGTRDTKRRWGGVHSQTDDLAFVSSTVAHGPGHCRPRSEPQCAHRNGDHVGAEGVAAQRLPGAHQELVCSGLKGNPHARVSRS